MDLHSRGAVGTCGAAVVTKDSDGKVHVKPDPGPPRWRPRALKGCGTSNSKQDIELPGGWETA
jgi:hypothetical protein